MANPNTIELDKEFTFQNVNMLLQMENILKDGK